jgi:hypothetical protein
MFVDNHSQQPESTAPLLSEDDDNFRYARCIKMSKRVNWTVEGVIQGRTFDPEDRFLPDSFAGTASFPDLSPAEIRFVGQIQGRTYANMFGLLERYVNAKVLELSQSHCFGDQTKLEALIRFSDEEIKHQHLFRCVEQLIASSMPHGYCFVPQPNPVARMILGKSTWAVLALTLMVEIVTQAHYRETIKNGEGVSPLYKDVFRYHWIEECQHAILDELEWRREDRNVSADERHQAVDELIELAGAIDGILQDQAKSDASYFLEAVGRPMSQTDIKAVHAGFLRAYRWQYIFSGAENAHFVKVLKELTTPEQTKRVSSALAALA